MILRPATLADADFLFRLRNDPETRAASLAQHLIDSNEHIAWLTFVVNDPARALFIAEADGQPVGTGRLDVLGREAVVSLTVDPECRGRGYGTAIIKALVREARRRGVTWLCAEVKPENHASRRAFASSGFAERPADLCQHCAAGRPHHTNSATSIAGDDRHVIYDLHEVEDTGGVGLAECTAAHLFDPRLA